MTEDTQAVACPACQAANPTGVKFCAQCGAPLATPAMRVAPPVAAVVTPPIAAPTDAMAHVRDALARANATVTGGDGQTSLDYQLEYSERLLGPMKLQFAGSVAHAPGGTPAYVVTARMQPQALAVQFGFCVLGAVVLGFMPRTLVPNEMFVGAVAIALGVTVWVAFAEGPRRVRRHLEGLITPSASAAPLTSPMPVAAPASGGVVTGGDVFAQLERLAQLQATGLLTAEDVATKKAELLQRI